MKFYTNQESIDFNNKSNKKDAMRIKAFKKKKYNCNKTITQIQENINSRNLFSKKLKNEIDEDYLQLTLDY